MDKEPEIPKEVIKRMKEVEEKDLGQRLRMVKIKERARTNDIPSSSLNFTRYSSRFLSKYFVKSYTGDLT